MEIKTEKKIEEWMQDKENYNINLEKVLHLTMQTCRKC
jgi:hypothetical protein